MHIDPAEMQKLAEASNRAGREDLYAGIHKALRAYMADTLVAIGRTDPTDAGEVVGAVDRVVALLALCASHVHHENEHMHPAIEARAPGVSASVAGDHDGHLHHIAYLRAQALALPTLSEAERPAALHVLYLTLAGFVADNLQHMHVEETRLNQALWAHYGDDELRGLHDALVSTIEPPEMMQVMRWMLPSLNAPQRLQVLQGMQASAPPPAFEAVLDLVQPLLSQGDWAKLMGGLGRAAVPGRVPA